MSVPVKVLEHRADVEALKLADLLVEFVNAGLVFSPDHVRPVLAARLRRELSRGSVKRLARIMSERGPWAPLPAPAPFLVSGRCPDGGTCHHDCGAEACFRTKCCGPLSGVFLGDAWPEEYR